LDNTISIVVGFDQREAVAYHVFCQSVLERSSSPVRFIPLSENLLKNYKETHSDGSNQFIYSRFLAPYLSEYKGWAIFADGDMVCQADITDLWNLRDESKAVLVVKHDYKTKAQIKYLGNKNENYPRKNWSSLILWNCEHTANKLLTPDFIQSQTGSFLHRFSWLSDDLIGDLPAEWNWLAIEYP
jgi:lipopolysaccharide biosynthesis glycosyltransferase